MKVVCLGDSLTAQVAAYPPRWQRQGGRKREFIGTQGTTPANHEGYGSSTWGWHATGLVGWTTNTAAFIAVFGEPQAVVILLGTNDAAYVAPAALPAALTTSLGYADTVVGAWRAAGAAVYVCHIPGPCTINAAYVARGQVRADWELAVATYNAAYDARYPTIRTDIDGSLYPATDCFHPSDAGYEALATAIRRAMNGR